jgi:hypothetical protein
MRPSRLIVVFVGALLFVAVAASWVRSHWIADSVYWSDRHRDHCIGLSGGRLVYLTADWPNARVELPIRRSSAWLTRVRPWWEDIERFKLPQERWLILRRVRGIYPYEPQQMMLSFFMPTWDVWWVPAWPLVLVSAVMPGVASYRWHRRRRRVRRGLCRECGYDLRESGARCPECGTVRVVGGTRAEAVAVAHGGGGV